MFSQPEFDGLVKVYKQPTDDFPQLFVSKIVDQESDK